MEEQWEGSLSLHASATLWCYSHMHLVGSHPIPWGSTLPSAWVRRLMLQEAHIFLQVPSCQGAGDGVGLLISQIQACGDRAEQQRGMGLPLHSLPYANANKTAKPNQTKPVAYKVSFSPDISSKELHWKTNPREASYIFWPWTFSSSGWFKHVAEQGSREGMDGQVGMSSKCISRGGYRKQTLWCLFPNLSGPQVHSSVDCAPAVTDPVRFLLW